MIELIEFKGETYPKFQSEGFAAKFAMSYASQVCRGIGVDVGCHKSEWAFPGAICVDPNMSSGDALNFPKDVDDLDYIFSSHCLEHIPNWVEVLDYWHTKLKDGGVLFLYLPDHSQKYWRPWHNRKHVNSFTPEIIKSYFEDCNQYHKHLVPGCSNELKKWENIFVSGIDLNNSFMVMCQAIKIYATK